MAHYNLIFHGEIIEGASLDEVKSNLARLFKADTAKTEALFSGKKIIIKKNLDAESAKKYLAILKKAGAVIKAVKTEETSNSHEQINSPGPISSKEIPATGSRNTPSSGLSAGLASLVGHSKPKEPISEEDDDLQLAPIGANLLDHSSQTEAASIPDMSQLTLAEAETGSLEEFAKHVQAVEIPDIESLTMTEANTGSMAEFATEVEPAILPDISDIHMAEQDNTPLSEQSPKAPSVEIPDVSNLSMSEAQKGSLEGIEEKPEPVKIPDISHIEIEKSEEEKKISQKATFQIN